MRMGVGAGIHRGESGELRPGLSCSVPVDGLRSRASAWSQLQRSGAKHILSPVAALPFTGPASRVVLPPPGVLVKRTPEGPGCHLRGSSLFRHARSHAP